MSIHLIHYDFFFLQEEVETEELQSPQDYPDEDVPLTIDESITDDEQPELPKSPIKASDLQEEMQR